MAKPRDRAEKLGRNAYGFEKCALKLSATYAECSGSLIDSGCSMRSLNECNDVINFSRNGLPLGYVAFKHGVELIGRV